MAKREIGRRRVGMMTVAVAAAGTAAAGALGLALANGTAAAAARTTTTTDQITPDSTNTQSNDQLQAPPQAPSAGSSGRSHAGSGGS
jgi:hypothetical protein